MSAKVHANAGMPLIYCILQDTAAADWLLPVLVCWFCCHYTMVPTRARSRVIFGTQHRIVLA